MNKTFDVYNVIMVKGDEKDLMSFLLKNDIDDNAQSKTTNKNPSSSDNTGGRPELADDQKTDKTIANKEAQS